MSFLMLIVFFEVFNKELYSDQYIASSIGPSLVVSESKVTVTRSHTFWFTKERYKKSDINKAHK
jgi:hypothetical protein